ncbi:hypothetical protein L1049_019608 [Liquidambar formosana]|uniref:Uncharacterized protein n=1 Tax=Liquidambar formosana TaxID=63359 RepID=A0AAP0SA01_LIQFO
MTLSLKDISLHYRDSIKVEGHLILRSQAVEQKAGRFLERKRTSTFYITEIMDAISSLPILM